MPILGAPLVGNYQGLSDVLVTGGGPVTAGTDGEAAGTGHPDGFDPEHDPIIGIGFDRDVLGGTSTAAIDAAPAPEGTLAVPGRIGVACLGQSEGDQAVGVGLICGQAGPGDVDVAALALEGSGPRRALRSADVVSADPCPGEIGAFVSHLGDVGVGHPGTANKRSGSHAGEVRPVGKLKVTGVGGGDADKTAIFGVGGRDDGKG